MERKYQVKDLLQNYANQDYGALVTHKHTEKKEENRELQNIPDYG